MKSFNLILLIFTVSWQGFGQRIEYTCSKPGDTARNYYITIFPNDKKVTGFVVLLPGFGELPAQTLKESDIPRYAAESGYMTIIPALDDWSFFYIDQASHEKLNKFLEEISTKYDLKDKAFFIGGHSFGGTMAVQYAQRAYRGKSGLRPPEAVFALDPPLDIERLFNCMTTTNRPKKSPISIQEDNYISDRIEQVFKTDPGSNPQYFWEVSPYAQSDPAHGNLKALLTIPIRIYNEPDIGWYIENRSIDYYCMNSLDSAAMINWLKSLGNTKAELVITQNKGYRKQRNIRHPHSWSIADGRELVNWMKDNEK